MNRNLTISFVCLIFFVSFFIILGEKNLNPFLTKQPQSKIKNATKSEHSQKHNHDNEEITDHRDPEIQRRMGIFHYNEGNHLLKKGDWEKAIQNYKMALHHDKTLGEVYINLSNAYMKGQNFQDAFNTLKDLEKYQPGNHMLHYNLACYYSLTGKIISSLNSLQNAIKFGFKNMQKVKSDPDLENLRRGNAFQKWIAQF